MDDDERARREREFFDAASAVTAAQEPLPSEHARALLDALGDVRGKLVLDCGAGTGETANKLGADGARAVAFDLSTESLRLGRARAERSGVPAPAAVVSAMECLPFPRATFDAVVGKSILHHVDVAAAMREVHRVMKPGARGVFLENQVTNPLLRFAREHLTGRFGVARVGTPDEHPLVRRDYDAIRSLFPNLTLSYPDFRFFGLVSRNVLRYRRALWLARALGRADDAIYRRLPRVRKWGYHVILVVRKPA